MNQKPANAKIRALFRKLQALAERGVEGERDIAQRKLARLKARYDFNGLSPEESRDLFSGRFSRSSAARRIYSFNANETVLASSVKWAIETATKVRCRHGGTDLLAEATPATARRLSEISDHIAQSFRVLLDRFDALNGVTAADRNAFILGLYDGMMGEVREAGQRLPGRSSSTRRRRSGKARAEKAATMQAHPYSIALSLGKQIRFSTPIQQIAAELEAAAPKRIGHSRQ